jgi:biotin carboxylase
MTTPSKRLLLFTGKLGYQTRSFEEAALKLGVQLVYVTDRCHQLEDPWGDRAIAVHFENPEAAAYTVMEELRGQNVDGVLALGDRPAVAAAYAARGLGVRYNHPAAVDACRSKLRMREVFRDAGLRVPWFRDLPIDPMPEPALLGIQFPCVLKPLSLSASQGVMRANHREEFLAAAARIRRLLGSPEILSTREPKLDRMLVEGYIPGREVAVEGLLTDGHLRILAIFDKPDPLEGPYFEETIYVTPSRLPDAEQRANEQCARAMPCARWGFRTDRFTRNFESMMTEFGHSKLPRGPSGGFAPALSDSCPVRKENSSGWKNCFCVMRSNSRERIRRANRSPPAS